MSIPPTTSVKNREHCQGAKGTSGLADSTLDQQCHDIDVIKRDRFELLSAYLDGEVTPDERQMVLEWMHSDPNAKCLYNRLLHLRQGLREANHSPCGDADAVVAQVFHSLNRRMQLMGMAGLGVVVVGVLSVLSGSMGNTQSIWRLASGTQPEYLEIALDQPAFPIPKAPTAVSLDFNQVETQGVFPVESEL
jgi:hypothetical protein